MASHYQPRPGPTDLLPDVRDGLNRIERLILYELHRAQPEFPGRSVPTAVIYGRVVSHGINIRPDELSRFLARLGARRDPGPGPAVIGDSEQ